MNSLFVTGVIVLTLLLSACTTDTAKINPGEPQDPDTYDLSAWDNVNNGINVAFASTNYAIQKSIPPAIQKSSSASLHAWRGETVHTQLAVWAKEYEGTIKIYSSGINHDNVTNHKPEVQVRPVRYVLSDSFINGCGYRDKDTIPAHISPDRLEPTDEFILTERETRPVWLTLEVDTACKPGIYEYITTIISEIDTTELNFTLEVVDRILPHPSEWSFHLDLWQNPYAVARYHNVPLWSQEHWDLLEPLLAKLASAGQKCITTTLNDKPWGGQTFDPFGSMITWLKGNDGKWDYDYSIFDQYVSFAMDCGISKQINCYTMVPWGNRFTYFDEDSTDFVEVHAMPGSVEYNELWRPFLIDFREHLRDMGWLEIATIAMDERREEDMRKIISLIKELIPEMKITLAGNILQPDIDRDLYDLSISIDLNPSKESVVDRVNSGKPTTFYTCCSRPEHPNNFTFSPPADNTYIGWFASGWGYSGFLRWAYNSWVEDPVYDSRFRTWPSGDTYFVYPHAQSSVRMEKLIEGIQDYEKINILKDELANDASLAAVELEKELNVFLESIHYSQLEKEPSKKIVLKGQDLLYRIVKR